MVIPGPGLPRFGSPLETMANRSPLGSHEKSVPASRYPVSTSERSRGSESTFELYHFHGKVFFTDSEDFKVAKDRFLRFRVAIDFDTQEVTMVLPVKLTLPEVH